MESFGSMIPSDLPPAGDRVDTHMAPPPDFGGYTPLWLQSGTAALALALLHQRYQRPDVSSPEVLIPAYGCPDLVAASIHAGVRPVAVDTGCDDPGLHLEHLKRSLTRNTVAVIAVNFLGIRDRLEKIKALLPAKVALLEDNAQWYPELTRGTRLEGDYVILSFGRGKPVTLLAGGLLLVRNGLPLDGRWLSQHVKEPDAEGAFSEIQRRIKLDLYNLLRQPQFYFWVNRNPLIHLGETRYRALDEIRWMDKRIKSWVGANVRCHLAASRWREVRYDERLARCAVLNPMLARDFRRRGRLLRYPVLCNNRSQRDQILRLLQKQGLGATAMYGTSLPEISGVEGKVATPNGYGNARTMAHRLLTLPVHSGVTPEYMDRITATVRSFDDSARYEETGGPRWSNPPGA